MASKVAVGCCGIIRSCDCCLSFFVQFKLIHTVRNPFFGNETEKILTSPVSKLLPVPDALLGAFGYIVDAVSGGTERWKTK